MNNWRANTRIYYGWWVVSALFFILLNTGGAGFYVFPVFVVPLMEEFGWSVTQISVGAAIWAVVFGLSGPLIGLLIPRIGVCGTMLGAACIASLTCLGYASLQSLWMLYATMFVSGFAIAGSTLVPAQTLITNWFNRYRGRAMSWTMLGIGLGGLLLAPFNEFLIRVLGWRRTWLVAFCITWLIVIPLIAVFVRTKPADMGLLPDGGGAQKDGPSTRSGLLTKRALASLSFWLLFSTYVLQLVGLSAMNFHFVPFAIQQAQFTSQQAAFFLGMAAGFSMAGRLLFGWLADRWNPAGLLAITGVLLAAGPMVLELFVIRLGLHNANPLWMYSFLFGLGIAGHAVILPVLVGRCFGELHFSTIMGLVMSGFALGVILGIPVTGKIFDSTGSYEIAFLACIAVFLASSALAIIVQPGRHHGEFVSE
jgi:MFS family permease